MAYPGFRQAFSLPLALLSLLFIPTCGDYQLQKPRAFGREKEILVICSNKIWQTVEEDLRREIEIPIHAVRWEPIFEIAHSEPETVSYYKEWDKIILIESLENMKLLPYVVDDETLKNIGEKQGLFFSNIDVWARGQRVAGLAAPKDDQLPRLVKVHGKRIFKDFLRQLEEQEKRHGVNSHYNSHFPFHHLF